MRYRTNRTQGAILATIMVLVAPVFSTADSSDTAEDAVKNHLEFVIDFGANCTSRNAKQILIQNHHPSRSIKVKLFRFFGDVRQPGRASYILESGEEPLALGCDKIQGQSQRWEIHKADFQ